jgi:hypothetical protein
MPIIIWPIVINFIPNVHITKTNDFLLSMDLIYPPGYSLTDFHKKSIAGLIEKVCYIIKVGVLLVFIISGITSMVFGKYLIISAALATLMVVAVSLLETHSTNGMWTHIRNINDDLGEVLFVWSQMLQCTLSQQDFEECKNSIVRTDGNKYELIKAQIWKSALLFACLGRLELTDKDISIIETQYLHIAEQSLYQLGLPRECLEITKLYMCYGILYLNNSMIDKALGSLKKIFNMRGVTKKLKAEIGSCFRIAKHYTDPKDTYTNSFSLKIKSPYNAMYLYTKNLKLLNEQILARREN